MCPDCGKILERDMRSPEAIQSIRDATEGGTRCRFHAATLEIAQLPDFERVRQTVRWHHTSSLAFHLEKASAKDLGRWLRALGWARELPRAQEQRAWKLAGLMVRDEERGKLLTAWQIQ